MGIRLLLVLAAMLALSVRSVTAAEFFDVSSVVVADEHESRHVFVQPW